MIAELRHCARTAAARVRAAARPPAARDPAAARAGRPGERGSATVLVLALVAVALVLAVGVLALTRAAQARGLAQAAADLGAIASAQAAQAGSGAPCGVAATVVAANGARMTGCAVLAGGDVRVSAERVVTPLPGWSTTALAHARAGPAR